MKRSKLILMIAVAIPFAGGFFWFTATSRAAYETPEYKVVRADGKFEIRDYPPMTLARTPMSNDGMDSSFVRLFRFIETGEPQLDAPGAGLPPFEFSVGRILFAY